MSLRDFNWTEFTRRIAIHAPLAELYDAWTKPAALEKWFLQEAVLIDPDGRQVGKNDAARKGHSYEWKWFAYDDKERGEVTNANGKDFLQFTFAGKCLVDVKLVERDGFVIVELAQKNIPTDDQSKRDIRLGCHTGWSFFLVNLKSIYEGGIDLRNKTQDLAGMLNN